MPDPTTTHNAIASLAAAIHIPIAQLTPLLNAPSSRSVKAVVTLTWPFSSATDSVAFLLAEPDFRLRRTRGQVRVQFSGSSAKAVAEAGIANGDEVVLSLDEVAWVKDAVEETTPFATPGRGVEFELKFAERLLLQFRQEGTEETRLINVDHPAPEPKVPAVRIPSPQPPASPYTSPHTITSLNSCTPRQAPAPNIGDEFASPAFIKRARNSYGSMFEDEHDLFAVEDGSVRGKGRKRTRLSSSWRFQSRSPTPEVDQGDSLNTSPESHRQKSPIMTDEGVQTVSLDNADAGNAAKVLASFHQQSTNAGSHAYRDAASEALDQQGEAELVSYRTPSTLPVSQTQPIVDLGSVQGQGAFEQRTPENMPLSPQLQPVPSDVLPLVSPLVTNKYGALFGMNPPQGVFGQISSITEQPATSRDEPIENGEDQEDLYGAKPSGFHGQASTDEVSGFQNPSTGLNALEEASTMHSQLLAESHFGQWHGTNARLSPAGSPQPSTQENQAEGSLHDEFYGVNGLVDVTLQRGAHPMSIPDELPSQHYPDPEEINHEQPSGHSWAPRYEAINYPDLEDADEERATKRFVDPNLRTAPAMSRSGSAQSNAIDLTDKSDEEELEEHYENEINAENQVDEEEYENGTIEEGGLDADYSQKQPRKPALEKENQNAEETYSDDSEREILVLDEDTHDHRLRSNRPEDEGAMQEYEDEEGPYEHEMYEDEFSDGGAQHHRERLRQAQGEDFEEEDEEGPYEDEYEDEYEEDDEMPEPAQREPVVIDLLSSDDEEAALQSTSRAATEDFQAGSDEEMDVRSDLINEIHEHSAEQPFDDDDDDEQERYSVEEDRIMGDVDNDDELPDTGDEADSEDLASGGGDLISKHKEHVLAAEMATVDDELGAKDDASATEGNIQQTADPTEEFPAAQVHDTEMVSVGDVLAAGLEAPLGGDNIQGATDPTEEPTNPTDEAEAGQVHDAEMVPADDDWEAEDSALAEGDNVQEAADPTGEIEAAQVHEPVNGAQQDVATPKDSGTQSFDKETAGSEVEPIQQTEKPKNQAEGMDETGSSKSDFQYPPPPQSLFARMFNLDGANDELGPGLFYSRSPADNVMSEVYSNPLPPPRDTVTHLDTQVKSQLPTPEATQLSLAKEASGLSVSSIQQSLPSKVSETIAQQAPAEETSQSTYVVEEQEVINSTESHAATVEEVFHQIVEETTEAVLDENADEKSPEAQIVPVVLDAHNTRSRTRQKTGSVEPITQEEVAEGHPTSSRRSHRQSKSTSSTTETTHAKAPVTPKSKSSATQVRQDEPMSARTDQSMPILLDEPTTPNGHDASIELALSALDSSPAKQPHDLRSKAPGGEAKLKLSRILRTELSEFSSLKVLRFHIQAKLDVLAVVTTVPAEPERAKGGPRHYQISFYITDQSIAAGASSSPVTEVRVYRPYKDALPIVKVGDGVLLRNFEVLSIKNKGFALQSTESSSWAVFGGDDRNEVDVRGPPIEHGDVERDYVALLRTWYSQLEPAAVAKIHKAHGK